MYHVASLEKHSDLRQAAHFIAYCDLHLSNECYKSLTWTIKNKSFGF